MSAAGKSCDCYLGLLFTMEDVAVYGYITPLKIKIIVAIQLSDSVVKDIEIIAVSLDFSIKPFFFFLKTSPDIQGPSHGLLFISLEPIFEADDACRCNEGTSHDSWRRESKVESLQASCG